MAKKTTAWFCRECGYESVRYLGRCPSCGEWSSLIEQPSTKSKKNDNSSLSPSLSGTFKEACSLKEISTEAANKRLLTGFGELDRVLGGGLQEGSFSLIGGDPGIGKSTLLLQLAGYISESGARVLYVSGEESASQVKNRSLRLNISQGLLFLAETSLENILAQIEQIKPELLVIDSIQSMHMGESDSFPGSPAQIRHCGNALLRLAKSHNITVIVVGHITKEGQLAGPKLLEHMVDVVLYFEGDKQNYFRVVRGAKNRFGPADEVGLFEMIEGGLREINNPSALFLSERLDGQTGTSITATLQGSRIILAEIQALTGYTSYSQPKRMFNGLDYNRANQGIAILERRVGLSLAKQDIYASVVGGLYTSEPAADLAICLAIASCARDRVIQSKTLVLGEIGLSGEVRSVPRLESRLKEAERLGFERVILPDQLPAKADSYRLNLYPARRISEALKFAFS